MNTYQLQKYKKEPSYDDISSVTYSQVMISFDDGYFPKKYPFTLIDSGWNFSDLASKPMIFNFVGINM